MGRLAATFAGQLVTREQTLNNQHEFAPAVDQLTMTSAAPVRANAQGKYPIPEPGVVIDREYQVV